jgi:hypothetical protein
MPDNDAAHPPPVIGKTSATERDANSSDKFNFWLAPAQIVNPFDIVQVEHMGQAMEEGKPTGQPSCSYGLVTTIEHRTDSPNHLANFVSSNFGDVNENNINTPRVGTNVAKVNILSNNGEIYMPVQSDRPVIFASPEGIQESLGIYTMTEKNRIPAGLIKMSNGATTVAYIDQEFILGPEGAHINVSGISGLATKTSFAMFMLQSILQKSEKTKDENGVALSDKIAVIILNVKQGDLLQIDQRPDNNPSVEQMEMWEALRIEPRPFKNVRYLLPRSNQPGLPNSFLEPVSGFQMFAYALQDAADKLDLLLSDISDQSGAMDALVGDVMQGLMNREPAFRNCNSWENLLNGEPLVKNGKTEKWGDHYVSTIGKFRRHLRRIVRTRSTGVFTNARARNELNLAEQIREIEGGQTFVVDIARLSDEEQKLVFGDVLRTVPPLPHRPTDRVGHHTAEPAARLRQKHTLLALGDLLDEVSSDIDIPIYLADSVLTPSAGDELDKAGKVLFMTSVGEFALPRSLVKADYIDELANLLEEHVKNDSAPSAFTAALCEKFPLDPKKDARLGFVITQSVLKTEGGGEGFRRLQLGEREHLRMLQVDDFSQVQCFEGATNRIWFFRCCVGETLNGGPRAHPAEYSCLRIRTILRRGIQKPRCSRDCRRPMVS